MSVHSSIFVAILAAMFISACPAMATLVEYEILVTDNTGQLRVNGTEVLVGDTLTYIVEWDTAAVKTSGTTPIGTANYVHDSIQLGGGLVYFGTNMLTNNSTATVDARKFEVKNNLSGSEDKWKTESIFSDLASMTVQGNTGQVSTSSYTPEKVKIKIKSSVVDFLLSNELPLATSDLTTNLTAPVLSSMPADARKFELKWKGNVDGLKDPKVLGTVTSVSAIPEPATMSLLGLGGLALLRQRKK